MFRKVMAALVSCAAAAALFTSCGKQITVDEEKENSSSSSSSSTAKKSGIANFTAPEQGDQIIEMTIKDYGTVTFRLFPEYAEKGVENFVALAQSGYYDGLIFHRIIKDFMIQGGDPTGTGMGGESTWGGSFDGGADEHLINCAGALVYANSGSTATDGSQFYIVTGTVATDEDFDFYAQNGLTFTDEAKQIYETAGGAPWLDGDYTVFGQVIDGLDVVFEVQNVETNESAKPLTDVVMESVKVGTYDGSEIKWYITDYTGSTDDDAESGETAPAQE